MCPTVIAFWTGFQHKMWNWFSDVFLPAGLFNASSETDGASVQQGEVLLILLNVQYAIIKPRPNQWCLSGTSEQLHFYWLIQYLMWTWKPHGEIGSQKSLCRIWLHVFFTKRSRSFGLISPYRWQHKPLCLKARNFPVMGQNSPLHPSEWEYKITNNC